MNWHHLTVAEAAKTLHVNIEKGLSQKEAEKRQKKFGKNKLEDKKPKPLLFRFLEQFKDFMILILLLAALVSFFVSYLEGKMDFTDPLIIFCIIFLNALLGTLQEVRAEKSLSALKKMAAPTAKVLRNGNVSIIAAKDLVPGDIIYLETGYFVPADARLCESIDLKVEESSLTGESHPVKKNAHSVLPDETIVSDRDNMVLATSVITYGRGKGIVVDIGMNTQVGKIARFIMEDEAPETPLQKRLDHTGKRLGIASLCICFLIFCIGIFKQHPIFDMFMTSVSLAVAAIPEGLPAIVTIMLSLGVQRMAKKHTVIRKLPAVETLGSATVICSDKTGTLTENKMTVTQIASADGFEKEHTTFQKNILILSCLCNNAFLQKNKKEWIIRGEPTEQALVSAANDCHLQKPKLDLLFPRIFEIPFDSKRKRMTTVHKYSKSDLLDLPLQTTEKKNYLSITKGAPDFLLPCCRYYYQHGKIVPLTAQQRNAIMKINQEMASHALRIIAVAFQMVAHPVGNSTLEENLIFVGLLGMIDPPRKEVASAVLTCKIAGITPMMITGDHILTACAIAKDLGILEQETQAITGKELAQYDDRTLQQRIKQYRVFARVTPEHKMKIVKALQANGEIVAMTGDGVNDAPALKIADIGCAMGLSGTDVAKSAADMILTDDNFATIVAAIKEGRGIYDNIKKAIHFLLSSNIGEIITIFFAILLGLPSPLIAVQLLWVNLVTDSLPAIALGVEPAEKNIMRRKPISPKKGFFSDGLAFQIFFEGMMIGMLSLFAFLIGLNWYDHTVENPIYARTMAFCVLSLSELFHAFNMRSNRSLLEIGLLGNWKLLLSFFIGSFLQIGAVSISTFHAIFEVCALQPIQWIIVFILAIFPIFIVELQKAANRILRE